MCNTMIKPIKVKCNNGKYRRAIFGFGSYIADYPEQCMIACVVQGWCPKYTYIYCYTDHVVLILFFRCLAPPSNFDDPSQPITPCTTEHTIEASHHSELLHAWDTFRIISNVVVCISISPWLISNVFLPICSPLPNSFLVQTSMKWCRPIFFTRLWKECSKTI